MKQSLTAPEIGGTRLGIDAWLEDLRSHRELADTMDEGWAYCGQGFGQQYNGACPAVSLS